MITNSMKRELLQSNNLKLSNRRGAKQYPGD